MIMKWKSCMRTVQYTKYAYKKKKQHISILFKNEMIEKKNGTTTNMASNKKKIDFEYVYER